MKVALITGVTGQDGAYLSRLLLEKGYAVFGSSRSDDPDVNNLKYLDIASKVKILKCDLLNYNELEEKILTCNPDEIYNLAGQSSVDYSFREPAETLTYNIESVMNILEVIRKRKKDIKFYQATTCEMYSASNKMPIKEGSPLFPSSPYGVSKAAGHLMVINYRETYGIFCVSGILFNHESHLRKPEYFIRKLIRTAIDISNGKDEYIYLGQADNKRDLGFSPRYVEMMWLMLQNKKPKDYVICSGQSISIMDITAYVLTKFNAPLDRIKIDKNLFRNPNVPDLYGDSSKARGDLGWNYNMSFFDILDILIEEELKDKRSKND